MQLHPHPISPSLTKHLASFHATCEKEIHTHTHAHNPYKRKVQQVTKFFNRRRANSVVSAPFDALAMEVSQFFIPTCANVWNRIFSKVHKKRPCGIPSHPTPHNVEYICKLGMRAPSHQRRQPWAGHLGPSMAFVGYKHVAQKNQNEQHEIQFHRETGSLQRLLK